MPQPSMFGGSRNNHKATITLNTNNTIASANLKCAISWDYGNFAHRKRILQKRMRSHPVGLDVWVLVWTFV